MWAKAKIAKPILGKRDRKQPSTSSTSGKDDEVDEEPSEAYYNPEDLKRPKYD